MNLDALLPQIETVQLVLRVKDAELAYPFKRVLTQHAAYESLLHTHRRQIHLPVVQTYGAEYGNQYFDQCVCEPRTLMRNKCDGTR